MARPVMDDTTLGAFCETVALLLSAGIQVDESVAMVADDASAELVPVYRSMYVDLVAGRDLAWAMEATGAFPPFAVAQVAQGWRQGRLEEALLALGRRCENEARLLDSVRRSLGYPAALLCVMSVVLAFTVGGVLPVFTDVYDNLAGGLTQGSFSQVGFALALGWAALAATVAATAAALVLVALTRTAAGRERLTALSERLPATREAAYGLALSRAVSSLAASLAAGRNADDAAADALSGVDHPVLAGRLAAALDLMTDAAEPCGLVAALVAADVIDPVYGRILAASARTGGLDAALDELSADLSQESIDALTASIDGVEPVLSAFLTVAVGATLVAVMLPLVGIMGSMA